MEQLLERLAGTDQTLDRRLVALDLELRNQMAALEYSQSAASKAWIFPFTSLAIALLLLGVWGCRQFFRIRKLHLY